MTGSLFQFLQLTVRKRRHLTGLLVCLCLGMSDIAFAKPKRQAVPAAVFPEAPFCTISGTECPSFSLLFNSSKDFETQLRKALADAKAFQPDFFPHYGTERSLLDVQISGETYQRAVTCRPQACQFEYIVVLYNAASKRLVGRYAKLKGANKVDFWLGGPTADERAFLQTP